MQTLTLYISDKVAPSVLHFLTNLPKEEIEIINENAQFKKVKNELQEDYEALRNPKTKFFTIEEVDQELESIISYHENKIK